MTGLFRAFCCGVALFAAPSLAADAQDYPARPIRAIATSSAGGISDIFMRALGDELSKRWGQPIIVENRAGGQFNIGAKACADAQPDGYTICIMPADVLQFNRHLFRNLNYDLFKDLEPITTLFTITQALAVSSTLKVSTLEQLADYARGHPKTLAYTAAAIPHQLFMETFKKETGADIVRLAFKGGGDAVYGLVSGNTPVAFFGIGNFIPQLRSGEVTGIAVDSERRSPLFPEIPTLKELRPAVDLTRADFSLWAPKGTSAAIIRRLNQEISKVGTDPSFADRNLIQRGLEPVFNSPEAFAGYLQEQRVQAERTAKEAGLQPQ